MLNDEMRDYLSVYEGHFVTGVSFFASGDRDMLEVRLLGEAERPSIVLHLEGVHAYSLQKPTDLDGAFADSLSVAELPAGDAPWPTGAEELLKRHSGLPDLYLVELSGPFWLVAVASILTVSAAI